MYTYIAVEMRAVPIVLLIIMFYDCRPQLDYLKRKRLHARTAKYDTMCLCVT